ncbi:MAG: glycosyltransferase family 2 protein [Pikeienuella sp.]|uniref:glycosyltransferase family 2 protein n=1 Tax=Pikeienuella sp. TaxID=2831957 RepID=UPI00391C611B
MKTGCAAAIWRAGPGGDGPAPPGWAHGLRAGDSLAPGASRLLAVAPPEAGAVIADDAAGEDAAPRFKPCFDPLLLERIDYAGRAVFFRERALGPEGAAALAAGARPASLLSRDMRVAHLPYPAVILGPGEEGPAPPPPARPPIGPVAAIVPNRNSPALLRAALAALDGEPEPPALVIVDNGSDDAETLALYAALSRRERTIVERRPAPFNFAAMVNRGAELALSAWPETRALLLLNNDISAPAPGWLRPMEETLAAPGIGIVGSKLLFPDRTIQHAGVIVGHGGVAGHELKGAAENAPGLCGRMAAPHLREAVTAAAMLVRREAWEAASGFDARAFPVAFNDVDFCLRAGAAGWETALDPRAVLIHHEGASRRRAFSLPYFLARQRERAMLRLRHGTLWRRDRFESPWRDLSRLDEFVFKDRSRLPPIRF